MVKNVQLQNIKCFIKRHSVNVPLTHAMNCDLCKVRQYMILLHKNKTSQTLNIRWVWRNLGVWMKLLLWKEQGGLHSCLSFTKLNGRKFQLSKTSGFEILCLRSQHWWSFMKRDKSLCIDGQNLFGWTESLLLNWYECS